MGDIAEGLGGVIEGALAGRAVEPAQGATRESGETRESGAQYAVQECANCKANVTTTYCPECGQKRQVHRSLAAIGHDLIHGVLHLDGKFWKTLPLLVFKPGKLTRRYIDGERAKFVSPMAMFLFSVFAMFAVFQMVGLSTPTDLNGASVGNAINSAQASAQADLEDAQRRLSEFEEGSVEYEEALADQLEARQAITGLERAQVMDFEANPDMNLTGIAAIDDGLIKKWRENPGLMLYKLQANGYKFSWLLIPLSIPFVWLIFAWKRRFKAYDHAIFVTYSLSFMSLLFIAASLVGVAGAPTEFIVFPLLIIPPLHMYKQLRHAYELTRFSALWRLFVMSIFIWVIVALFAQALLLLGAF